MRAKTVGLRGGCGLPRWIAEPGCRDGRLVQHRPGADPERRSHAGSDTRRELGGDPVASAQQRPEPVMHELAAERLVLGGERFACHDACDPIRGLLSCWLAVVVGLGLGQGLEAVHRERGREPGDQPNRRACGYPYSSRRRRFAHHRSPCGSRSPISWRAVSAITCPAPRSPLAIDDMKALA